MIYGAGAAPKAAVRRSPPALPRDRGAVGGIFKEVKVWKQKVAHGTGLRSRFWPNPEVYVGNTCWWEGGGAAAADPPALPSPPPGVSPPCRALWGPAAPGELNRGDRHGLKVQGLLTSAPQTEVARVSNSLT